MTEGSELTKCIDYSSGNRLPSDQMTEIRPTSLRKFLYYTKQAYSSRIYEKCAAKLLTFVGIYLNYIECPPSGKYRVSFFNSF